MGTTQGNAGLAPMRAIAVCMGLLLMCLSLASAEEATARLYKQLRESVVTLYPMGPSGSPLGSASGVVVRDGRTILTNYHAVAGAKSVLVAAETATGQEWRTATIHETAPDQDLASIRFEEGTSLKAARLASKLPEVGTSVLAIGSPLGFSGTLSTGIVSQVHKGDDTTMIQTTAPISPGSSGGGLFTESGELCALTSLYLLQGQQLNFAVFVGEMGKLRPYVEAATPAPGSPESRAEFDFVYIAGVELKLGDPKEKTASYFDVPRTDGIEMVKTRGTDDDLWMIRKEQEQGNIDCYALIVFEDGHLSFINKSHDAGAVSDWNTLAKFFVLIDKYSKDLTTSPTVSAQTITTRMPDHEKEVQFSTLILEFGARHEIIFTCDSEGRPLSLQETLSEE